MKIKELIRVLTLQEDLNREVVFHIWTGEKSVFKTLEISANPNANTSNLFVLIEGHNLITPKMLKVAK